MNKAELLAPVGKMENAIAAIENGADALFVGGKGFNARQAADNFTEDELEEIVKYATLRGVRVYVTVNILIKEEERAALYDYLKYLEAIGVHAIIIQDLGIAHMVKKYFPNLRLHASTQMSAHSIEDVRFLQSLGFKRVVLAREMQLKEIEEIVSTCDIEIETFVHGALCYSYSGQCLMSSLIGGRSGNRGRCAQPCRMRYNLKEEGKVLDRESYLLSLKDICSLEFLPELLAVGVHSLKVEGRMKSPEYVASVIGTYRKYLDKIEKGEKYEVDPTDLDRVKGIFNRGGFSKGYYYQRGNRKMLTDNSPRHIGLKVGEVTSFIAKTGMATIQLTKDLHPGDGLEIIRLGKESVGTGITKDCAAGSMIKCHFDHYVAVGSEVYLTKNHQLLKEMQQTYKRPMRKMPIQMAIKAKLYGPVEVTLTSGIKSVTYAGGMIEPAGNNPVTKEQAQKQLTKLGSTSFVADDVQIQWPTDGYIGISELNAIRREAVTLLEQALLEKKVDEAPMKYPDVKLASEGTSGWAVHVTTMAQLEVVLNYPQVDTIYWEWQYNQEAAKEALARCKAKGVACYLALPSIMKEKMYKMHEADLAMWQQTNLAGFLVRNMGQCYALKDFGKTMIMDYNLNVANSETVAFWVEQGASRVTLSPELSKAELQGIVGPKEKIVYGYLPVMTSSQCVLRGTASCQKDAKNKHHFELEDRKGMTWQVQTDCKACMMQILSYEPLALKRGELVAQDYKWRIQLTQEDAAATKMVLRSYLEVGHPAVSGINFKSVL